MPIKPVPVQQSSTGLEVPKVCRALPCFNLTKLYHCGTGSEKILIKSSSEMIHHLLQLSPLPKF